MNKPSNSLFNITVLVAALGYFVDIYDLLLFQIVRGDSLKDMGLSIAQVKSEGEFIISVQMIGLLVGGIIWGVMGDKKGRLSVLFGSIVLYSIANIINGFVQTPFQYGLTRFFAGIGLAGELGAGITLVAELVSKEKRGLSTSFVAGIGLTGAVVAYFISQNFHWRTCYFIGGGLGFCLLILRISVLESGMFTKLKELDVQRGNFFMFFTNEIARFTLMLVRAPRLRRSAYGTFISSSAISAMSAVSRAASLPAAPITIPTSAAASAGASLMPSPTIATAP